MGAVSAARAGGASGHAGATIERYSPLSLGQKEDMWAVVWGVWVVGRERCGVGSVGGGQ